jgi:uridine kinase
MSGPEAFTSVSTWRTAEPGPVSAARTALVGAVADWVVGLGPGRIRVGVDGRTGAGKTSFGHELAAAVRERGRPTARASLDDFKFPWRHAREHGYDRLTGEGYYRNPWDVESVTQLLLGDGPVTLCAHDPLTGVDHRAETVDLPPGTVLVVDGVFAFRPEYGDPWDARVWLEVDAAVSLARGTARDGADAEPEHRDRYAGAEAVYEREVGPRDRADLVIDNTDLARPRVTSWRRSSGGGRGSRPGG